MNLTNFQQYNNITEEFIFCISRLRSLGVSPKTLHMLYCSLIESVLTSCLVWWFGTLSMKNRSKLNCITDRGSKVVGVRQTGLSQPHETRAKRTLKGLTNPEWQVSQPVTILWHACTTSGRRLTALTAKKAKLLQHILSSCQ